MLRFTFLYLIFYTLNSTLADAQNLMLEIIGENETQTTIIDSLNYKKEFADYSSLKKEIAFTFLKLQKNGFIECELISTSKKNDSLYQSKFHLNKKFHTIYIYYNSDYISKELLSTISNNITEKYFTIPISQSESALTFLNKKVSEKGLPFASIKLENISKKNDVDLQGELIVNSAKNRVIDKIIIKGYEKFPKTYLKSYLKIKEKQSFNLNDIKQKTEGLKSLSFAKQIRDPEILFTRDSTTLYLYLKKRKSNTFDGFLGFGNNEASNKIEFNGYLNLNLINNLNYGESFRLIYKSDENEQRTFDLSTTLPYILKTPIGIDLNLNLFKKDSTYTIANQSAKLFYQINKKNKITSGISITNSNNSLENSDSFIKDFKSTFVTTSFEYSNRTDKLLFPLQSYFLIGGEIGKRNLENNTEKQQSLRIKTFKIFNLNDKNSIYLNLLGETLISNNYLTNELIRFGGVNSIRGFEENSIFASLYSTINSEYRYLLNNSIYIHSIMDAAYYENEINQAKEKLFGFGFGVGIITKAGLFKLNYANGLSENQPFKLSNSKIHISLNAFF